MSPLYYLLYDIYLTHQIFKEKIELILLNVLNRTLSEISGSLILLMRYCVVVHEKILQAHWETIKAECDRQQWRLSPSACAVSLTQETFSLGTILFIVYKQAM
jgi:hypothetical protein